jgi:hypothetical protein
VTRLVTARLKAKQIARAAGREPGDRPPACVLGGAEAWSIRRRTPIGQLEPFIDVNTNRPTGPLPPDEAFATVVASSGRRRCTEEKRG